MQCHNSAAFILVCDTCFKWYLMEVSLQDMFYSVAVFFCCKASFISSLATSETALENKTSFQSLLLFHIQEFLSVPVMAVNCLSKYIPHMDLGNSSVPQADYKRGSLLKLVPWSVLCYQLRDRESVLLLFPLFFWPIRFPAYHFACLLLKIWIDEKDSAEVVASSPLMMFNSMPFTSRNVFYSSHRFINHNLNHYPYG